MIPCEDGCACDVLRQFLFAWRIGGYLERGVNGFLVVGWTLLIGLSCGIWWNVGECV